MHSVQLPLMSQCILFRYCLDTYLCAFCQSTTLTCYWVLCSPAEHHETCGGGAAEGVRLVGQAAVADVADAAVASGGGSAPDRSAAVLQLHAQ